MAYLNGSNNGSSSDSFSPADQDPNSDKEWAGRLFALPFAESDTFALRGFGIGIASTYTDQEGTTSQTLLPTYRTSAQTPFFQYRTGATATIANGSRVRLAPQLYYYTGSLGLMGEYTHDSQDVSRFVGAAYREDTMDTYAWQLTASWFLTGEEEAYRGYKPNSIFSLDERHVGSVGTRRAVPCARPGQRRVRGRGGVLRRPEHAGHEGERVGAGRELVPEREPQSGC